MTTTPENSEENQHNDTPAIKPSLINPAWANQKAESYGLSGQLAKTVGESLSKLLGKQFAEATSHENLFNPIKQIVSEDLDKVFQCHQGMNNSWWGISLEEDDDN